MPTQVPYQGPPDLPLESRGLGPLDYPLQWATGAGLADLMLEGIIDLASGLPWEKRFTEEAFGEPGQKLYTGLGVHAINDPEYEMQLMQKIAKQGLRGGFFADLPHQDFGPLFLGANIEDLPQPVFRRYAMPGFESVDPEIEYAPNWSQAIYDPQAFKEQFIGRALQEKELRDAAEKLGLDPASIKALPNWEDMARKAAGQASERYGRSPLYTPTGTPPKIPKIYPGPEIPPGRLTVVTPEGINIGNLEELSSKRSTFRDLLRYLAYLHSAED